MDNQPFDLLKAIVIQANETMEKAFGDIETAAEFMGRRIVEAFKATVLGVASVIDMTRPAINFISGAINELSRFVMGVPPIIASFGILGFLALGAKGKLVIVAIAGVYNKIQEIFATLLDFVVKSTDKIAAAVKKLGFDETAKQITEFGKVIQEAKPDVLDGLGDMQAGFEEFALMPISKIFGDKDIEDLKGTTRTLAEEYLKALDMIIAHRIKEHDVVEAEANDNIEKTVTLMGKLKEAATGFKDGFKDAMEEAMNVTKSFQQIGKDAFKELTDSLTNFVMTGKLSVEDLARTIIKQIVNALVGAAVSGAMKKAMAMFKMDAIKKSLISVYEGALRTFAQIPFPFNILAVGGAISFGMGLVNKIRGFEKGGRPPVGQPSIVGEKGAELFVPDQAGTIVPNNQLGMSKPVTVNFNINTVDARGFNELLVNSRGVIVNMINTAVNEKGKAALI